MWLSQPTSKVVQKFMRVFQAGRSSELKIRVRVCEERKFGST
jgi:hypothetical protein